MDKLKILATGFDVFPGASENPTAWAIQALQREDWKPLGASLSTQVLPVKYGAWTEVVEPLLSRERPTAVIAFGLSAKTTGFTLESTARNSVAIDRPDFSGTCSTTDCVAHQGPAVYPSTLPFSELASALRTSGLPVVASDHAGDYLCNLLFYNLMHASERLKLRMAGFIHTPYLTTQIERLERSGHQISHGASLSEADFMKGVKTILQTCADRLIQ